MLRLLGGNDGPTRRPRPRSHALKGDSNDNESVGLDSETGNGDGPAARGKKTGWHPLIKVAIVVAIIAVVAGIIYAIYIVASKEPETTTDKTKIPTTTPPTTTPSTKTTTTPQTPGGGSQVPVPGGNRTVSRESCVAMNKYYKSTPAASWTGDDRNTAIWLITKISPSIQMETLQRLTNAQLKPIVENLCEDQVNCAEENSYYVPKDVADWTEDDRNTAIWLLTRNGTDVRLLSGLTDEQLSPLLKRYCTH